MTLSPYSYYEISFTFSADTAENRARVSDFLSDCGVKYEEIVFSEVQGKGIAAFYTRSKVLKRIIATRVKKALPSRFRLKQKLLVREDWFDKWQLDYQIMPLGNRFILVPLWQKKKYSSSRRIPIYLDPKGASGSGQHPTTHIMACFLEKISGKFQTCLDLGTGTGILGIMAAKLGASEITAIDNDSVAVKSAKFNFKLNGIQNSVVKLGDVMQIRERSRYDLVCANLISAVLDPLQNYLFASVQKGGYLLVSGIHIQNYAQFSRKFRHSKFRCLRVLKKRGWTGMLFKRIN